MNSLCRFFREHNSAVAEEEEEGEGLMVRLAKENQDRLLLSLREQQEEVEGGLDMGSAGSRTGASLTGGSSAALSADMSHARAELGVSRLRGSSIVPPEVGRDREGEASIGRGIGNVSGLLGDVSRIILCVQVSPDLLPCIIDPPFYIRFRDAEDSRRSVSWRAREDVSGRDGVSAITGWQGPQQGDMMDDMMFPVPMDPPAHSTVSTFPRGSEMGVGVDNTAAAGARTITLNAAAQEQTELQTTDFRISWPSNINNKNLNYWQRYLVMYVLVYLTV